MVCDVCVREKKVVAHLRRTRGSDVNAACGQLRAGAAVGS